MIEQQFSTKSREQLYREIFKISPPKLPPQLEATLVINEVTNGLVEVIFSEDRTDFSIPAPPIMEILSRMLKPELRDTIQSKIDEKNRLSKHDIERLGLQVSFDARNYQVFIAVPPGLRSKQTHQISGVMRDPYAIPVVKPNPVSAYVNVRANQKLRFFQHVSGDTSFIYELIAEETNKHFRQPAICYLDGALNVFNVVLEGAGYLQENGRHMPQAWRNDVRLVYDRPKSALRFSAGDIRYPVTGYQSLIRMGGIGITKDFSMLPYQRSYPTSESEFFLADPSEVEIWVNGVMIRKMRLEPGTHSISGIPFITGNNDVKIVTRDFAGRHEIIDFLFLFEYSLLAKGKSEYSCNLGFPTRNTGGKYDYAFDNPLASLAYQRGLTNILTVGGYGQASLNQDLFGLGGKLATRLGLFDLDAAGSYSGDTGVGFGARLGYAFESRVVNSKRQLIHTRKKTNIPPLRWNWQAEYLAPKFLKRLMDSSSNAYYKEKVKLSSNLNMPMADWIALQLGVKQYFRRDTTNLFECYLRVQNTWFKSLRTSATIQFTTDDKGRANPAIIATAQWYFRAGFNGFMLNERVSKHAPEQPAPIATVAQTTTRAWDFSHNLQWDYANPAPRSENLTAGIGAQIEPDYSDYNGRIGYQGNQGGVEIRHDVTEPASMRGIALQHQTDLNIRTALVYAGSAVALSRPIYGGFVVAKGIKNLRTNKILVNPTELGYEAASSPLGPAVLPLYGSYQLKDVRIMPQNASVGSIDEKLNFTLFPQYKSGFCLVMGKEANVLVVGTLLLADGSPLAYQNVTITSVHDEETAPIKTFTNGVGRFQFMGRGAGTYEISFPESMGRTPITITIPKDNKDFYQAGELGFSSNGMGVEKKALPGIPDKGCFVDGKLVDKDGAALGYQSLVISLVDDPGEPPTKLHTNNKGSFVCMVAKPGEYKVVPADSAQLGIARFVIPRGNKGSVHVGNLVLPGKLVRRPDSGQDPSTPNPSQRKPLPPVMKTGTGQQQAEDKQQLAVSGLLRDPNGNALAVAYFTVISLDDLTREPIISITDDKGIFLFNCGKPGRYRITVTRSTDSPSITFDVPPDTKGVFDIGSQLLK